MEIFTIWIFSMIIGVLIGNAKGRAISGFVWSFLFGPLGVLVVLCLSNLKKQKELLEQKQVLAGQMKLQQAQLEAQLQHLQQLKQSNPGENLLNKTYRIAKNGKEMGEMSVSKLKLLLKSGHLTTEDYFFDTQVNDWLQLECMEELHLEKRQV
ncbi:hypothetical protein [Methylotuvimicrobium sp. KM2]|uniref:hypothetical protein n=1 Tax=Methylotuvimicrobium sp. KM2 TaxID=3133976 RepID=UPI003100AC3A